MRRGECVASVVAEALNLSVHGQDVLGSGC